MQSSLFKIIKNHNFTTLIKIINYSFLWIQDAISQLSPNIWLHSLSSTDKLQQKKRNPDAKQIRNHICRINITQPISPLHYITLHLLGTRMDQIILVSRSNLLPKTRFAFSRGAVSVMWHKRNLPSRSFTLLSLQFSVDTPRNRESSIPRETLVTRMSQR